MENQKFWIQLGKDLGEAKQLSKTTNERLEKFIDNDFHALEEKVGKLSTKVAWVVGIISALTLVGNALLRVL